MLAATGSLDSALEVLGLIGGLLSIAAAMALGFAYFKARAGQSLATQQGAAVDALEAELIASQAKVARLEEQSASQQAQIVGMQESHTAQMAEVQEQVAVLRELVTQSAKVDILRQEVEDGFAKVLERIK